MMRATRLRPSGSGLHRGRTRTTSEQSSCGDLRDIFEAVAVQGRRRGVARQKSDGEGGVRNPPCVPHASSRQHPAQVSVANPYRRPDTARHRPRMAPHRLDIDVQDQHLPVSAKNDRYTKRRHPRTLVSWGEVVLRANIVSDVRNVYERGTRPRFIFPSRGFSEVGYSIRGSRLAISSTREPTSRDPHWRLIRI